MPHRKIDHLVFATNTFEETIDWFEKISGVRAAFGGYHKSQGTKNALVSIGEKCYLEILGIDYENTKVKAPRWMGIDLIQKPKFSRWAIASEDLKSDSNFLKRYNNEMGQIQNGHRKKENGEDLNWSMIMPLSQPEVELAPFVIDWRDSEHPANSYEASCELLDIQFTTRNVPPFQNLFDALKINIEIVPADEDRISVRLKTPKGVIEF